MRLIGFFSYGISDLRIDEIYWIFFAMASVRSEFYLTKVFRFQNPSTFIFTKGGHLSSSDLSIKKLSKFGRAEVFTRRYTTVKEALF